MKRLALLLLLLACVCSAQVETGGLTIPGDGAVQVARKSGEMQVLSNGLIVEVYSDTGYDFATTTTAVWSSQCEGGYDLVQATEVSKPTVDAEGYMSFDGTDDYMQTASVTQAIGNVFTIFAVTKRQSVIYENPVSTCNTSDLAGVITVFGPGGGAANVYPYFYTNDWYAAGVVKAGGVDNNIEGLRFNRESNIQLFYATWSVAGSYFYDPKLAAAKTNGFPRDAVTSHIVTVGGWLRASAVTKKAAKFKAILIYDRYLSDAEMLSVYNYLRAKYP